MAVSVRMNPLLEKELEQVAKRQGVTKSQFIVDAVERALGRKNPYELMLQVREELTTYRVPENASVYPIAAQGGLESEPPTTGEQFRRILQSKHEQQTRDWVEYQASKTARPRKTPQPGASK